ncbi:MAG: M23 family metallopeptidase [Anaerovorax sp.]
MRITKKPKDKVAVALTLCFCALAIASIFTMRSGLDQLRLGPDQNIHIAKESEKMEKEQKVTNPVPVVDSKKQGGVQNQNENTGEVQPLSYMPPVVGTVTSGYSSEFPIYSNTLEQYVIHEGVDIEAPKNTSVVAISDGVITRMYTDDRLGITIEVLHPDGLTSRYACLSTSKNVGIGDVVKKGDVLSTVGTSSLFESLEPAHLHFEVLKEGVPMDPSPFIKH